MELRRKFLENNTLEKSRVLFVDDEPVILMMLKEYFSDSFEIQTVQSAEEALKFLQNNIIDVVVADERMMGMSGTELLIQIRKKFPNTARILMTAHLETSALIRSINEGGISYYITKPVDPGQLKLAIERLSEISRLRTSNEKLVDELRRHSAVLEAEVEQRSSELRATNVHLRNLQEMREQMVRIAVHDLKAPLGNLRIALSEMGAHITDEQGRELLDIACESSSVISYIVDDMLTVAQLTKTEIDLQRSPVFLQEIITSSIYSFMPTAEKKFLRIQFTPGDNLPLVNVDVRQMRQMMDNLISNAVKYTPPHGEIFISAERTDSGINISVRDTGLGMTDEDIHQAFHEFRRLSARPTGGESSTGLGLFIVKKIVELHGGSVHVFSEGKNKGTTFILSLPLEIIHHDSDYANNEFQQ